MAIIQWVNLDKDSDYLDDPDIDSLDRCGKLSVKTAFSSGEVDLSYKVKVTPIAGNVTYDSTELGRNSNFKMTLGTSDLATDDEVLMEESIQLPAAGGNKYKLEAKGANGSDVKSAEVEAKRKLYYQFMHMEDSSDKVTPYSLSQLEQHCDKYFIKLTKLSSAGDKKIPFRKCINSGKGGRFSHVGFANDVKAKYDLKDAFKKVGCVTALSNYIASFKSKETVITHIIGGVVEPACTIDSDKISLWLTDKELLWHGLDDTDDADKSWFIKGAVNYQPTPSSIRAAQTIEFFKDDVEIAGTNIKSYGGRREIFLKIKPGSDLASFTAQTDGTISFYIKFNVIKGFSAGFSWGGAGFALTTCCTKAWFEDKKPEDSDVIWNHELGHRIGMTAYGDKDHSSTNAKFFVKGHLPNSPPKLYGENRGVNDKGHQGPHCESGSLTYDASKNKWSGTPGCVLFGATGTSSASSPLDYCADCTDIVKKLDLSFS